MICYGPHENICYCLDYELLVSEVVLKTDPDNPRKKKIKSVSTFLGHPAIVIGEIEVEFDLPHHLYDFGSPITDQQATIDKGRHRFQLVSVDVPKHRFVRNIDIVLVPRTHFGLALGGLATLIKKQVRAASPAEVQDVPNSSVRFFPVVPRQLDLPFRDST